MIKSSQYSQINTRTQNVVINSRTNEVEINNEAGFVLLPAYGINPYFNNMNIEKPTKLYAYKPSPESGDKIEGAVLSALASQLIPGLGTLAHLFENLNHIREFSEQIFDDSGRRVEINTGLTGVLKQSININPKDALDPMKAFLPVTPFTLSNKPTMEYWKQRRHDIDEEKEQKKKRRKNIGN